jgi:hypothetical protein
VVAFGQLPGRAGELSRRWAAAVLAAAAVGTAVAPGVDVVNQVRAAGDLSSSPGFYEPLVQRLLVERAADPGSAGQRVEVVDPRTHWSSVYVADRVPLARGWNRQADAALDPLFYEPGALDAGSYTAWLHSLAVGWVAVPDAPLDYASVAEGELVAAGVPALRRTWAGDGWTLYRVRDATPLVEGARLVSVDRAGLTVDVPTAGPVLARVRWMPSLVVSRTDDGRVLAACPVPSSDGMITVRLPAGRWRIAPDVDRGVRRQLTGACPGRVNP